MIISTLNMNIMPISPAKVILSADALLLETVMSWTLYLVVGAGGHNVFPSPLTTKGTGAGAEQNRQAVFLRHPLQETAKGPVALLLVALVGPRHLFGAGQNIF